MTDSPEDKKRLAARIRHPTGFWIPQFRDDTWQRIEAAGKITLSDANRKSIQASCSRWKEQRACTEASASPAKVKAYLEKVSAKLGDVQNLLQEMISGGHVAQSAFFAFQLEHLPIPAPNDADLSEFKTQAQMWSIIASRAASKIPEDEESRGRRNVGFNYELLDALESAFKAAGGRKKLRLPFLEAVELALGTKITTGSEALRRGADKARLRKLPESGQGST